MILEACGSVIGQIFLPVGKKDVKQNDAKLGQGTSEPVRQCEALSIPWCDRNMTHLSSEVK